MYNWKGIFCPCKPKRTQLFLSTCQLVNSRFYPCLSSSWSSRWWMTPSRGLKPPPLHHWNCSRFQFLWIIYIYISALEYLSETVIQYPNSYGFRKKSSNTSWHHILTCPQAPQNFLTYPDVSWRILTSWRRERVCRFHGRSPANVGVQAGRLAQHPAKNRDERLWVPCGSQGFVHVVMPAYLP